MLEREYLCVKLFAIAEQWVVLQTAVEFLLVFNVMLELVQGHERGILEPMKDSDITIYKSYLLKLSCGAPGRPVSRF
mgnify:FL=1